jgi:hypothetical protein
MTRGAFREASVFNPTQLVIDAFVEQLRVSYQRTYGVLEPEFPNIIAYVGRIALENIAQSDAPYHDANHTIMVTLVGQEILKGKQLSEGGVSPRDWLHFTVSLLCHDIGYVRGVCRADRKGTYVIDDAGETITLQPGATDASLTPYHVARGKLFVQERFGRAKFIDLEVVQANIEHTRFPVPEENGSNLSQYPGLVRAADLVGQLADPDYLRKIGGLFREFEETGINAKFGYKHADDLRRGYPGFFWKVVSPHIQDGLHYLRKTQEGRQWLAHLYAHVFEEEHRGALTER